MKCIVLAIYDTHLYKDICRSDMWEHKNQEGIITTCSAKQGTSCCIEIPQGLTRFDSKLSASPQTIT